ncbi:MAG TPA: ribonuclease HII [Microthrixaceae bacterium]|nr:ribonuclease HII [Microthrixaceae bacterium]
MATRAPARRAPTLSVERELWEDGLDVVVGMDEVGRGSWAGPLTVAAVVLPCDRRVNGIRDSKILTPSRREVLEGRIREWCRAVGVGHASAAECDDLGMSQAQRIAARRALDQLGLEPDAVLLDGKWDFVGGGRTRTMVRGDARCLSIAAASIVAKVNRDRIMRAEAEHYPAYSFDQNKGYPCPQHKIALQGYGPSAIHRRSWVFMERLAWRGAIRFVAPDPQQALF